MLRTTIAFLARRVPSTPALRPPVFSAPVRRGFADVSGTAEAMWCSDILSPLLALEQRKKRILLHSKQMGIRENDLLLSSFVDKYLPTLSEQQLDQYEALLKQSDWDIYYWVIGSRPVPAELDNDLMKLLQKHCASNPLRDRLSKGL